MSFADALDILYEDNHLVAVNKPAGWPSAHGAGEDSLDQLVKAYLKEKYRKPGNVFLGVVHRLDRPVTGVLLFARTTKAAARLSAQFREGAVEKVYWAVVEGEVPQTAGTLEDWLRKDERTRRVVTAGPGERGAKQSLLHFHRRAVHGGLSLLELRPQTGRRHQIRVQLARRGWPVYGDVKYGSRHAFGPAVALHARSLTFLHPTRREPVTLTAEVPQAWRGRFAYLLNQEPA
ncbi:MAG TPA: RluA family pseudouridine synthase [Gemmataceae bacterium]